MLRKRNLDRRVALALGVRMGLVEDITLAFLQAARAGIANEGEVCLDGLGLLRIRSREGVHEGRTVTKEYVVFTKSDALKALMKEVRDGKIRRK